MEGFNKLSDMAQEFVFTRFAAEIGPDLNSEVARAWVKSIDNAVLAAEVPRLMRGKGKDWIGLGKIQPAVISRFSWFLSRFGFVVRWQFRRRLRKYGVQI